MSAPDRNLISSGDRSSTLLDRARELARKTSQGKALSLGSGGFPSPEGEKGDKGEKLLPCQGCAEAPEDPNLDASISDPQVDWRLEAMRKQVPPSGPIPFLVAREAPTRSGSCLSCGESLPEGQWYRCGPCARAAAIAVWRTPPDAVGTGGRSGGEE